MLKHLTILSKICEKKTLISYSVNSPFDFKSFEQNGLTTFINKFDLNHDGISYDSIIFEGKEKDYRVYPHPKSEGFAKNLHQNFNINYSHNIAFGGRVLQKAPPQQPQQK